MELAIVLGIVGVILGGVWAMGGVVNENVRRETMFQYVVQTVKGVRTYYEGLYAVDTSKSSVELTDLLIRKGAVPPEMVPDRTAATVQANTPWTKTTTGEGSYFVEPDGGNGFHFKIEMRNLPYGACLSLATRFSGDGAPGGLLSVQVGTSSPHLNSTFPVMISDVKGECSTAKAGSTLFLTYLLRQQ